MPVVSDAELIKNIKENNYSNVYYFYGKDIMTIETYVKRLSLKLVSKENQDYNLHKYIGKSIDLSELSDCADLIPLFSDKLCILINDFNAEDYSSSDNEFVKSIICNLPETTVIIFYNTAIDIFGGKKFPTTKNKKLIDIIAKVGTVCEFSYKKPSELVKPITQKLQKAGLTISRQNAELIAALCLSDMMMINNELDKLISYVNTGEVTEEAINLLVPKQLDTNAFALAKAVVNYQGKQALLLLDEIFAQRMEPIAVLSAISMSFIDLYRAKSAINANVQSSVAAEDFSYKANRKFAIDNAFRDVRKTSSEHLRFCINILAQTDISLKTTRNDARLLVEKAVISMLSDKENSY